MHSGPQMILMLFRTGKEIMKDMIRVGDPGRSKALIKNIGK